MYYVFYFIYRLTSPLMPNHPMRAQMLTSLKSEIKYTEQLDSV